MFFSMGKRGGEGKKGDSQTDFRWQACAHGAAHSAGLLNVHPRWLTARYMVLARQALLVVLCEDHLIHPVVLKR